MTAKVALVTGAAKRLGAHMVRALAEDGYAVVLHYHTSQDEAMQLAQECEALDVDCLPLPADLGDARQRQQMMQTALAAFGRIDVLVNSAAVFVNDSPAQHSPDTWQQNMQVNLEAPVHLAQLFAAQEHNSDAPRVLVNMLDSDVQSAPSGAFFSYHLAKTALWRATEIMAVSYAPQVRSCGIAPGPVLPAPTQRQTHFDAQRSATPLGYGAEVEDVVRALRFILATPCLNGEVLCHDSGARLKR